MRNSKLALKNEKSVVNAVSWMGAGIALASASIQITALTTSIVAKARGNIALSEAARIFRIKWGATIVGSAALATLAITDVVRSFQAMENVNPDQSLMYLSSALSGGVATFAAFAGGTAALEEMAVAPLWVLGWSPFVWAVIALVATGAVIYFSMKAEETQHGPVEILLKHSAWGTMKSKYTYPEEIAAWHSLQYSPQISAKWKAAHRSAGTLRLRCTLPIELYRRSDFHTILRVRLKGKELIKISAEAAMATPGLTINLDTHCIIGSLTTELGVERGWHIVMHQDASVELQYLYRPDVDLQPSLAVEQPGSPEPLTFTSSGWFTETIDPAKLNPVRAPK
jgi:hypothetical protein